MTDIPAGTSISREIPLEETYVTMGIRNPLAWPDVARLAAS